MKKIKETISLLLVFAIIFTFALPTMAATNMSDKGLEEAIKSVKERIAISKEYKKFSYNIYNQNDITRWNLNWKNEETNDNISIEIDNNNFISSYYGYKSSQYDNDKKIPKYSKEQGRKIAEAFINKLDSKLLSQYKFKEANGSQESTGYTYNYERQVNGISFDSNTLSITVNSRIGDVVSYYCTYSRNTVFEDATKLISLDDAKKAFMDKLGLKMVYSVKTINNKKVTYITYIPKYSNKYIDAITGGTETIHNNFTIKFNKSMAADGMAYREEGVELSPEEINAVKDMSELKEIEELDKYIRTIKHFNLDTEYKLSNTQLIKDWQNEGNFIWTIRYTKGENKDSQRQVEVSVDAKSGEIKGFWTYYSSPEGTKPQKTEQEAKLICDEVVKSIFAAKYSNVKFDDSYANNPEDLSTLTYKYTRVENGLECPFDYIIVSYDNLSGNINNIQFNWTKDVKFEMPTNTISTEKAYDILFKQIGFGLKYISDYSEKKGDEIGKLVIGGDSYPVKAVLGYVVNDNIPNIISATTGKILNSNGEKYEEVKIIDYTDIKGLPSENKIKILTQMSIRYSENELKASEALLQKDYLYILCKLNNIYFEDNAVSKDKNLDNMYSELINSGIITKQEKAPMSKVTREDAAKYFVKFLKLGYIAELKGIYKTDYKDSNKIDSKLVGYICLASGLKALEGSNGYFKPKTNMTRLDGLLSIYNYLSNK